MGQIMTTVSAATSREILDGEELLARCMGNWDFALRVLGKFRARLEADVADLDQALGAQDWDLLARLAHRIKGASASVSALQLRQRAAELEHAARARRVAELSTCVERLRHESNRLVQELSVLELDACEAR
jgi:HPt (histidine-containing phosphotransfer) domain-containing protein